MTSGRAHVIDDDGRRKLFQERDQAFKILRLEIDDDMPAERGDLLGDGEEDLPRGVVDEALDEIEAHAAHAGLVHRLQFVHGNVGADRGDTAGLAAGGDQGIDECAVIAPVAGRLDDDVALEAEIIAQFEQLLLRRVAGRVFAFRRVGEFVGGAEDMAMRIHGTGMRHESRF